MAWLKLPLTFSVPLPANSVCPLLWKQPFDVLSATPSLRVFTVLAAMLTLMRLPSLMCTAELSGFASVNPLSRSVALYSPVR